MYEPSTMTDSQTHILEQVLDRVRQTAARGETPVVVYDLDHTLFDNGPRSLAIVAEYAEREGDRALREAVERVPTRNLPYLLRDTLAMADVTDDDLVKSISEFWFSTFFRDEYIHHDVPLEGAAAFVRETFRLGATVVYLTGRDSPNMLLGTAQSLRDHGFPVGVAHSVMLLKPAFEIADIEFKTDAIGFIRTLGSVVGAFDNEPINCNLFAETFPGCCSVLMETAMAPNPPALHASVGAITNFERSGSVQL